MFIYLNGAVHIFKQLHILSSAFHIETEILVSSTSITSISIPSTSIQDELKHLEPIKRKQKGNTRKLITEYEYRSFGNV